MTKIIKADGSAEEYDDQKIRSSLIRAGVDTPIINDILNEINTHTYEGMSTQDIYTMVYDQLKNKNNQFVSRYNLKRAIMELGPTGFPFERFFAGVLSEYGYKTETNVVMRGKCVMHEIDIVAEKEEKRIMIEVKFHNRPGTKSDVRSALYTHARFLDVCEQGKFNEHWLVTNTKATSDAIQYGLCMNMKIISWDRPKDFSIRSLVEKSRLHPITALEHLSADRKRQLLEEGVVFAKDVKEEN
jgi:hypothetical protein